MKNARSTNPLDNRRKRNPRARKGKGKGAAKTRRAAPNRGRVFNNSSVVRGASKRSQPKSNGSGVEKLCSITDPFCKHAIGAKLPDGSPGNSLTSSARGFATILTGTTGGFAAAWVTPNTGGFSITASAYTTTSQTMQTPVVLSGISLMSANAASVRIVSCGFVIRAMQTASNAQGQFVIVEGNSFTPGSSYDITDLTYPKVSVVSNYSGMVFTYKFAPNNNTLAHQFQPKQSATDLSSAAGWPSVMIGYSGGATGSNAVANIEYFFHYEWIPISASDISVLAGPTSKASSMLMSAKAAVDQKHGGGASVSPESFSDSLKSTVDTAKGIGAVAKEVWDAGSDVVHLAETFWASL